MNRNKRKQKIKETTLTTKVIKDYSLSLCISSFGSRAECKKYIRDGFINFGSGFIISFFFTEKRKTLLLLPFLIFFFVVVVFCSIASVVK